MARLPQPGADGGVWGDILNDYLLQIHKSDGTLRDNVVTAASLAPGAVQASNLLNISGASNGQVLTLDSAAPGGYRWATVSSAGTQVNADWNATSGVAQILNRPTFAPLATTGSWGDISGKPTFAPVATSGSYNDLTNRPTIPAAQVQPDWNATTGMGVILNKPTMPSAQVNANWTATSGVAQILNKPTLATVATTGDYNDLTNKPAPGSSTPVATTTATGTITLAGDLAGSGGAPTVAKVNGIAVTGTPTAGQVLTASSGTAASWQTPSAGGGGSTAWNIRTATTATFNAANNDMIFVDPTAQGVTINLPAPVANGRVRVKRTVVAGNYVVIAAANGGQLDKNEPTMSTLNGGYSSAEYVSDGTNWWVF